MKMTNKNKLLFKIPTKISKWSKLLVSTLGTVTILMVILNIINSILKSKSINLFQPFYYKLFCLISISILTIFTLDYLIKFILYVYYYKNKEAVINKNYPKFIYNYLYDVKEFSDAGKAYDFLYIYYFFIYLAITVFIVFILIFLL
uniref:Uncharacterized protein n=1 Tax=Schizopora paradoxa TaxID=27342 RepID=A0A5B9RKU2_9AGAM|nr:hypothetical protein Schpa_000056 [Schizopora paradoxa]QEG57227.1 hypothetical protein Schpa_000056 [Schizopora paradoxa]